MPAEQIAGEMQLLNIYKHFGSEALLEDISLNIKTGSFTSICGPSGCGKTTLMNILAGYLKPDKGQCLFNGAPVEQPSADRLVVFQETALFEWMTVWENTLFGPRIQGKDIKNEEGKARNLINLSGLGGFENKFPRQLSGGMQRRAELIRALINEPKVLLLDEPFRGLDAMTRGMMQEYFINVFESTHTTMVLITSELAEAILMGETLYILSARPTKLKKEISINLKRPRNIAQQASVEFAQLLDDAYMTLEEEAIKTFELLPSK